MQKSALLLSYLVLSNAGLGAADNLMRATVKEHTEFTQGTQTDAKDNTMKVVLTSNRVMATGHGSENNEEAEDGKEIDYQKIKASRTDGIQLRLTNYGGSYCKGGRPCSECEGDCDKDSDCFGDLKCFQRDGFTRVPGCLMGGNGDNENYDYCYMPVFLQNLGADACNSNNKCRNCQGDCDKDSDCKPGLKCFQRGSGGEIPPGCEGGAKDNWDYCYADRELVDAGDEYCQPDNKCSACQGDCDTDDDCQDGLTCFHKKGSQVVPGCDACKGAACDATDFCFKAPQHPKAKCMSRNLCYDELGVKELTDKDWECKCVNGDSPNDPDCIPWHDCIEAKSNAHTDTLKSLLRMLTEPRANLAQESKGIQDSDGQVENAELTAERAEVAKLEAENAKLKAQSDNSGCSETDCLCPAIVDLPAFECECATEIHKKCKEKGTDSEKDQCYKNAACSHDGICESWKDSHKCTDAERASGTMLEVSARLLKKRVVGNSSDGTRGGPVQDASLDESLTYKRSC